MATAVLVLDTRSKKAKKFPVCIRVTHKSIPKMVPTGYKFFQQDWDEGNNKVRRGYTDSGMINSRIYNKLSIAENVISTYAFHLKDMTVYDVAKVIAEAISKDKEEKEEGGIQIKHTKLQDYGNKVVKIYESSKQIMMAKGFDNAVKSILKYHGNENLLITDIDEFFLLSYEAHQRGLGRKVNGYGAYLRSIRRIYNLAIKDENTEVTQKHYPFGKTKYMIKSTKGTKRAINTDYIKIIRDLEYKEGSTIWHQRNFMLFSFNMRGMNFIDMAFLTKDKLVDGRLIYKRRKTSGYDGVKEFNFAIPAEAQAILDYYTRSNRPGNLVFPILEDVIKKEDMKSIYKTYDGRLKLHNDYLNRIGEDAGVPKKLTSYVVRHTFATAGLFRGISKAVIGEMLGHTNYYTTEAYFDDFEQKVLDEAATAILA